MWVLQCTAHHPSGCPLVFKRKAVSGWNYSCACGPHLLKSFSGIHFIFRRATFPAYNSLAKEMVLWWIKKALGILPGCSWWRDMLAPAPTSTGDENPAKPGVLVYTIEGGTMRSSDSLRSFLRASSSPSPHVRGHRYFTGLKQSG